MTQYQDLVWRVFTESDSLQALTQHEIAERTGLPLTTAHRAVRRLIALRWLCLCQGRVILGPRLGETCMSVGMQWAGSAIVLSGPKPPAASKGPIGPIRPIRPIGRRT